MFSLRTKLNIARAFLFKDRPYYIQYFITPYCNLNCRMCNIVESNADLKEASLETVAKIAANLRKIGAGVVLLTGGEPFLRKDLPEIIKIFVDQGLNPRLQTAGFRTTREEMEACAKAGAKDINISLDSIIPEKQEYINGSISNSWHRAIESIVNANDIFSDPDRVCAFGTVLSKYNYMEIPALIELATFLGWYDSLVPVHITTDEAPMNFRGVDSDFKFSFPEDKFVLNDLKKKIIKMKKDGYNLFDSHAYLNSVFYFIEHNRPTWRKNNVCDSPNLYFAILPNGDFGVCADNRFQAKLSVSDDDFPHLYRSPEFKSSVYSITKACAGCNFGSYPEASISVRDPKAFLSRAKIVLFSNTKKIPKRTLPEVYEFIDHLREKYQIGSYTGIKFKPKCLALAQRYEGVKKVTRAIPATLNNKVENNKHRVLVTGANGFIGRAVVDTLLKDRQTQIIAVIRKFDVKLTEIAKKNNQLSIIEGVDLADKNAISKIPSGITHVVHSAALAHFNESDKKALDRNNIDSTQNLLNHLKKTSKDAIQRLLFTSSIGVHDRPIFYNQSMPIKEDSPFRPKSKYGLSKLKGERLVRLSGLPHVIARLGWVYGPKMRKDSHIRVFAKMCKEKSVLSKFNFPGKISPAYIDDVAETIKDLLFKENLSRVSYLVASNEPVSIGYIFATYHKILGCGQKMISFPNITRRMLNLAGPILPMRLRSIFEDYLVCNVDNLKSEGIKLRTSFPDGIRKCIEEGGWFN